MPDTTLSLTAAELSALRDAFDVALEMDDDEALREHGQDPVVVTSLGRKLNRSWTILRDAEVFPVDANGMPLAWPDPRQPSCYVDAWNGIYDSREAALDDVSGWVARESERSLAYGGMPVDEAAHERHRARCKCETPIIDWMDETCDGTCRRCGCDVSDEAADNAPDPTETPTAERRTLTITFDVTGFAFEEIEALAGEAIVQGERSDDHPEAPVIGTEWSTGVLARDRKES